MGSMVKNVQNRPGLLKLFKFRFAYNGSTVSIFRRVQEQHVITVKSMPNQHFKNLQFY